MKIQYMSDLHLEAAGMNPLQHPEADVVVLAGDIWTKGRSVEFAKQFTVPVVLVAGNHEFYGDSIYDTYKKLKRDAEETSNVFFLQNDSVTIRDVTFIGATLWTDFKLFGAARSVLAQLDCQNGMNDYRKIRVGGEQPYRKLTPRDVELMHLKSVNYIYDQINMTVGDGKIVVVTHHAPSLESISLEYKTDPLTPGYASNLEHLMGIPRCWIHGHVHCPNDYTVNGTRVVSNPRGYAGYGRPYENELFDGQKLIEV